MTQEILSRISDEDIRREYIRRYTIPAGEALTTPLRVSDHFRGFLKDTDREHFLICYLNGQNRVIDTEILFSGTLGKSFIYPREIVKKILEKKASAVVIGHNHPSGSLTPSRDDINITKNIKAALEVIDVMLHDHVIVAGDSYYSFADNELL